MKKDKIYNLDTLEKEILRLKLEAKNRGEKLDDHFDYFSDNYHTIIMNSIFHKKKQDEEKRANNFFESFFKNEAFTTAVNKVTDHIATRAAEGIDRLIDKLFQKRKND